MITLNDCSEFCEMAPAAVEEIAQQQGLPIVVASAMAHKPTLAANDVSHPEPIIPPTRIAA